jgi:hypothetical protein
MIWRDILCESDSNSVSAFDSEVAHAVFSIREIISSKNFVTTLFHKLLVPDVYISHDNANVGNGSV